MARIMMLACFALLALLHGGTAATIAPPLPSGVANPCTDTAIANETFFFAYPGDDKKFIQCDEGGNAFVQSCPPNKQWSQSSTACVDPDPAPNTVCQKVGQLVPDNCDHHDYFMCSVTFVPVRMSCGALFFNPAGYCAATDENTATCP